MAEPVPRDRLTAGQLDQVRGMVAQWRGFAVSVDDLLRGRSVDWAGLKQKRIGVMMLPVLGDDEPNPCRAMIAVAGDMMVSCDWRTLAHDAEAHRREVLKRCAAIEIALDLMAGMVAAHGV